RLDRHGRFRLTTAQSAVGAALRRHYGVTQDDADSVVLLHDGRLFLHSTAVLTILAGLERPWRWLSAFKLAPEGARDRVYRWIARRRYRLFGRRRACYVPRPQWRDRFLEARAIASIAASRHAAPVPSRDGGPATSRARNGAPGCWRPNGPSGSGSRRVGVHRRPPGGGLRGRGLDGAGRRPPARAGPSPGSGL